MPIITEADAKIEIMAAADSPCGPATNLRFSDTGGLTQFGAFVEILPPGSRSSLCHWHLREDEFVYMLAGTVTVYEGGGATILHPGQAACFKAGEAKGHYLKNEGTEDARYLVVGTRGEFDAVTYPDHDRVFHWNDVTGDRHYTTIDGTPGVGLAYKLPGA